jgi:hypothetical protein
MEDIEEVVDSDIMPEHSRSVGALEDSKLNEQHGNIYENKGPVFSGPAQSGNLNENAYSYAQGSGMLLKTSEIVCMSKVVGGGTAGFMIQDSGSARADVRVQGKGPILNC